MNGVGIDYQQTVSIVALREGEGPLVRSRLISDGQRTLIPHVVTGGGRWGSDAFAEAPVVPPTGPPSTAGPWIDAEHAPLFWRGLYHRVYHYLGRLPPVPQHGYQFVIALAAEHDSSEWNQVARMADESGFAHAQVIRVTDALLCRWLADTSLRDRQVKRAVVVAVGDWDVMVSSYFLESSAVENGIPRVTSAPHSTRLAQVGFSDWSEQLLSELRSRLKEPIPAAQEITLRDGAIEFASRLRGAGIDTPQTWTGPFRGQCYSTPTLSRRECLAWPSARRFAAQVPELIRQAIQTLSPQAKPDLVVFGGLGAVWPLVFDVLQPLWPIWTSPFPEQDVALGAAWWPVFGKHFAEPSTPIQRDFVESPVNSPDSFEDAGSSGSETPETLDPLVDLQDLPPWKR